MSNLTKAVVIGRFMTFGIKIKWQLLTGSHLYSINYFAWFCGSWLVVINTGFTISLFICLYVAKSIRTLNM